MIEFKDEKVKTRCLYMHPIALMILFDMSVYCLEKDLEFVVTETMTTFEEDAELARISSTHRSGRAFDLRNRTWQPEEKLRFKIHFKEKYENYAATNRHGERILIDDRYHGSGPHFHVQIHSSYSTKRVLQ